MSRRRRLCVGLGLTVILAITGCDNSSSSAPSTSAGTPADGSHLPHRGPPIPGLDAARILDAARAVLPEAEELTFRHGPIDSRAYTESKIGYPDPNAADITRGTPSVHVTWKDDGTVIFVACADLVDAGAASPVMAICTDLPVTGVPPGGLAATWQRMLADTWDGSQPFAQLSLQDLRFEADRPTAGPAIAFTISGAAQSGPSATGSSDL